MQSSDKAYFTGALGVLISRMTSILSGVLSLWFLTEILDGDQFAGYSVGMSVVVLLGYSIGLGTERSLLIRINQFEPDPNVMLGARLMRRIFLLVVGFSILGVLATLAVVGGGDTPAQDFVRLLSPVIPALALSLVLITWYQANHLVGVSQSMQGLNDALRCLFFGLTFVFGLGYFGVAAGALIGAAAPALYLGWRALGRTRPEPSSFGGRDILEGLQFLTMRVSQIALQDLGIIALGILGSSTGTAQFAVAVRFAILVESGQTIFAPTFMPRVLRHLSVGRKDLAAREYQVARVTGFMAALAFSIGLVLFGQPILNFFGDFGANFGAFLILVATYLLPVGMGMHSAFLSMTDKIGHSTANRVLSFLVFAVALWFLVPRYDAMGASTALLIALTVHEIVGVSLYMYHSGTRPFTPLEGMIVLLCCVTLCAIATGLVATLPGAAILIALFGLSVARERALILGILRDLTRIVLRQT